MTKPTPRYVSDCCGEEVYESTRPFTSMERMIDGMNGIYFSDNVIHVKRCTKCHKSCTPIKSGEGKEKEK